MSSKIKNPCLLLIFCLLVLLLASCETNQSNLDIEREKDTNTEEVNNSEKVNNSTTSIKNDNFSNNGTNYQTISDSNKDKDIENENKQETLEKYDVPSDIIDSLVNINNTLIETKEILKQLNEQLTNQSIDPLNPFFSKTAKESKIKFIDSYIDSAEYFRNITLYRYYPFDEESEGEEDLFIKDKIYTYATLYQEAMDIAYGMFYGIIYNRASGVEQDYAAFELRFEKANAIFEEIKPLLNEAPPLDIKTPLKLDKEKVHPVLALDILWIYHQRIWGKEGERFEKESLYSKLPVDDALKEIDSLIANAETFVEVLRQFNKEYNMERYGDGWSLDEDNGILGEWYEAVNDHLYAIQIFDDKDRLADYYGGQNKIPDESLLKYDIWNSAHFLNYKTYTDQYHRARDFIREQESEVSAHQ